MKYAYQLVATFISALVLSVACGNDDSHEGPPQGDAGEASSSAGRGGVSTNVGGADDLGGHSPGGSRGGAPQGGANPAAGTGGEALGGAGGEPAEEPLWLAFKALRETTAPLFLTGVRPRVDAQEVAPNVESWQWTPDGTKLIYTTQTAESPPRVSAFSVSVSEEGELSAPELLHDPLAPGEAVLALNPSPTGKTLALCLFRGGISRWYLRPSDGGGGDGTPVGSGSSVVEGHLAETRSSWSPNGTKVATVQVEDPSHISLFLVDAATGKLSQNTFEGGVDAFVAFAGVPLQWSPDGSRLFVSGAFDKTSAQRVLYAVDADDATHAVALSDPTVHTFLDDAFVVSSDGERVAFKAGTSAAKGLYLKRVGSEEPAAMVAPGVIQGLLVSADRFVYLQDHVGQRHFFVTSGDGGEPVRLDPEGMVASCNFGPCLWPAGESVLAVLSEHLYDIDVSAPSPHVRALTAFPADTVIDALVVAPDPSRVLLRATDAAGGQSLYLVERNTPSVTRILAPSTKGANYPNNGMEWSPDSQLFQLPLSYDDDVDLVTAHIENGVAVLSPPLEPQGHRLLSASWRPLRR